MLNHSPKLADFGHQTEPNRSPNRPQILPKLVPREVGSLRAVPIAPQERQERQESTKEPTQSAPGLLQERPGAPAERPQELNGHLKSDAVSVSCAKFKNHEILRQYCVF